MSSVNIIALADLHIHSERDPVYSTRDKVGPVLQTRIPPHEPLILLLAGDIAYSGSSEEYELAKHWFADLRQSLLERLKPSLLVAHAVPGNHDVFLKDTGADKDRTALLDSDVALTSTAFASIVLKQQLSFAAFAAYVASQNPPSLEQVSSFYCSRTRYPLTSDCELDICLLNSALASRIPDPPGKLVLEVPAPFTPSSARHSLAIGVFHHPLHWLKPQVRKELIAFSHNQLDLVVSGHEHDESVYAQLQDESSLAIIETGALGPPKDGPAEFLAIRANLQTKCADISSYYCSKHTSVFFPRNDTRNCHFVRSVSRRRGLFEFSKAYTTKVLENVEAPLRHDRKATLTLDDIYVMPEFREHTRSSKAVERTVSARVVVQTIIDQKRILVFGADRAGKTCFSKQIQVQLTEGGIPAIRLDGRTMARTKGSGFDFWQGKLEQAVRDQFGTDLTEQFLQSDPSSKAVIIDDYHVIRSTDTARSELVIELAKQFAYIICISGSTADADALSLMMNPCDMLRTFAHWIMLPLSPTSREKLIRKWVSINRADDDYDVHEEVYRTARRMDEVMKDGIVVPFPFEVLAYLQSQASTTKPTEVGSLGRAYEAMITTKLIDYGAVPSQLNTWYNYLSALAFHLYDKDLASMSFDEFKTWHHNYEKEYSIELEYKQYLTVLENAGILQLDGNDVSFRFRYVYCFFVAKYLAVKLTDVNVTKIIENLLTHIEMDDCALVLSFLCFSTSDLRIMHSLRDLAEKKFAGVQEFSFDSPDVQYVIRCGEDTKLIISVGGTPEENRTRDLERQDGLTSHQRRTQATSTSPVKLNRAETAPSLQDFHTQFRSASRLISIIGQALRSHAGAWRGDSKKQLASAAFRLGLRSDAARVAHAHSDYEIFVKKLTSIVLDGKDRLPEGKARHIAKYMVFYYCVSGTAGMLRHIASSVVSDELSVTLREVNSQAVTLPQKLISMAIQLEQPGGLSEAGVSAMIKECDGNRYAQDVLRLVVSRYLYIFKVRHDIKQRLIHKLNYSLPDGDSGGPHSKRRSK